MYKSVDEALRHTYRLASLRIEPMNNTQQIMQWCHSRGVVHRGGAGMTQHDWHAQSAMIRARVERILNNEELAAVEAQYAGNLSRIVDLTRYILEQKQGISMLACDAILAHIFTGRPKQMQIQDRFNWSKGKLYRQNARVKQNISILLNSAIVKIEADFFKSGIISS